MGLEQNGRTEWIYARLLTSLLGGGGCASRLPRLKFFIGLRHLKLRAISWSASPGRWKRAMPGERRVMPSNASLDKTAERVTPS